MNRMGFRFSENMYGTYQSASAPDRERRFMFHIEAVSRDWRRTIRDGRVEATGFVEAEGLASHAPIEGFMIIKPLVQRLIHYEFEFLGEDGASYRYAGRKTIRHLSPLRTWTTLPGSILDAAGRETARSVTRFDTREFGAFLRSFRFVRKATRAQPA
jgi:hypothetical protein